MSEDSVRSDRLTAKLDRYLETEKQTDHEVLQQLSFMVYAEISNSNLYELCKLIPIQYVRAIVNYYDGAPIVDTPTKDELDRCDLATVCYFLHHVKGKSWSEIKRILKLPEDDVSFSTVALDRLLSNLDKKFKARLEHMAKTITEEELKKLLEQRTSQVAGQRRNIHVGKKTSKATKASGRAYKRR